jgi:ribosome-associated heat shock protein Hsp15
MAGSGASLASVRLDRWLSAARLFKSRTLAQEACEAGRVEVNGIAARSSHALRVGDEVQARAPRGLLILDVLSLADKRLPAPAARLLYTDRSPPPLPREPPVAARERGTGRPTKAERRALDRFRAR